MAEEVQEHGEVGVMPTHGAGGAEAFAKRPGLRAGAGVDARRRPAT